MSDEILTNGITAETPKNLLLGAGTIHRGLQYDKTKKTFNFAETLVGATMGGNKLSITPEIFTPDLDGAFVRVKGLDFLMGEKAILEINYVELTPDLIKTAIIGQIIENSEVEGFEIIESKGKIEEGDYFENIAFVGVKTDGTPIIAILDNALCTNGFDADNKKKDATVIKTVFEASQSIGGDLSKLPYKIYVKKRTTTTTTQGA